MDKAGYSTDCNKIMTDRFNDISRIIHILNYLGNTNELEIIPPKFKSEGSCVRKKLHTYLNNSFETKQLSGTDKSLDINSTDFTNNNSFYIDNSNDIKAQSNGTGLQLTTLLEQIQESFINTQKSLAYIVELIAYDICQYDHCFNNLFKLIDDQNFRSLTPFDDSEELFRTVEKIVIYNKVEFQIEQMPTISLQPNDY